MRFRNTYMLLGSLLFILLWTATDPDQGLIQNLPFGAGTLATLVILLKTVVYVTMLHLSRRALADYLDLEEYFRKAKETSEGAGKALIAIGLMMVSIAIVMVSATLA